MSLIPLAFALLIRVCGAEPLPTSAALWERTEATRSFGSSYRDPLPVAERLAGLAAIWSLARQGFVWFDHVPELDWDRAYEEAIPKVISARSTRDYYRELMLFTALLRDGHSNTYPPKELRDDFYSRPGISTSLIEGAVLVTRITDMSIAGHGLQEGDEVLRVDGIPVHDYAETHVRPFQSASTPQDRIVRTYNYALLAGAAQKPVKLTIRHRDGTVTKLEARRSGYPKATDQPKQSFEIRPNGIAVLIARQFEDGAAAQLLATRADELGRAKALIIDLRGNGGGSTDFGLDILGWLTNDPLPGLHSEVRENDLLPQDNGGGLHRWRALSDDAPDRRPHERIFNGPVALLIDARTFSAAEDTAATFKVMHRGIIVGEPSGGSTGQPVMLTLPGGGRVRICVKRDTYPDGTDFVGVGVQPDVVLRPTRDDIGEKRDSVLEKVEATLLH